MSHMGQLCQSITICHLCLCAVALRRNVRQLSGFYSPHSCTVVLLNFTRPFYMVTESEGLDEVCVRLELPRGRAIRRPVTFRAHILPLGGRRKRNNCHCV